MNPANLLDLDADRALFEGKLQGIVVSCPENERPLHGLAGLLDWRFHGAISRCLRAGALTGKAGEVTYLPIQREGRVYHLILAGSGHRKRLGDRHDLPEATLTAVEKNLRWLKLPQIGLSRADIGEESVQFFSKHLKGSPFWIVR